MISLVRQMSKSSDGVMDVNVIFFIDFLCCNNAPWL